MLNEHKSQYRIKSLVLVLLVLGVPNFLMLLISQWLGVQRPVFNFDYAISALILIVSPFLVSAPFFLVCLFLDGLSLVKQIFPIVN